jgi:hypothetical protein
MDGSTSSVSKLIDVLPLIIISVIVLVGFFTWEVFTQHLAPFILLITSVLFAIWLYSGDIKTYLKWKTAGEAAGGDPIIPPPDGHDLGLPPNIIMLIVGGVVTLLATGLTLGITSYKIGNNIGSTSTQINVMNTFGYGFMGVGGIIIISLLWKAFRSSNDDGVAGGAGSAGGDGEGGRSNIFKIIGALVSSAFGIYMMTRATNLKTAQSQEVTDTGAVPTSIANTVLNIGIVMQVIALLGAVYLMYRYKVFHLADSAGNAAKAFKFTLPIICAIAGVIFILSHYNIIPSAEGVEKGSDQNNMYAAHAIVYFILTGITLLMGLGTMNTFTMFKGIGYVALAGLIGVIIWNFVALNIDIEDNFNLNVVEDAKNGNAYYQQVRDEVIKELKSSGKPDDVTDANIDRKIEERVAELNTSNQTAVTVANNVLLGVAVLITIIIGVFYTAKMKIVECEALPVSIKDVFIGKCNDYVGNSALTTQFTKDGGGPANIEKMTGDDWDKVMDDTSLGVFSKVGVTLASMSRWIPFFTIILIIICVSILFTKVTTSEATMEWIAKSFRGDMFPKVKSLIDTFFIVFIVGLLLCSLLLIPFVRKQNVGGLDVITKFIDSIQVWQYKERTTNPGISNGLSVFVGLIVVLGAGLSWYWTYLGTKGEDDDWLPDNFKLPLAIVILFAICCIPAFFHLPGSVPHDDFNDDHWSKRGLRLFLTSAYLVPLLLIFVYKLVVYFIPYFIGRQFDKRNLQEPLEKEIEKINFIKWYAAKNDKDRGTDLRVFGLGKILLPNDVVSGVAAAAAVPPVPAPAPGSPAAAAPAPPAVSTETVEKSKVNAVGQLIKVIFIVIIFVILILFIVYTVYKISAEKQPDGESATADGGFVAQLNTPTAHAIYVIMAIVAIAGFVAYLREKFKSANTQTPEDYVFNDLKPEDSNSPMRQLTFGMTHIIYIILMIVVLIYDTDTDDKGRMSVIGITVLGVAIIFFHYVLELIDNKLPPEPGAPADAVPKLAPMLNLLSNIRFIVNTVFLIILSILAYYKQHGVMVALIVIMFFFHLSKSILGVKLLKLLWAGIIYIPCLFLDLLKSSQSAVGDTTRTIWVIVAIEVLLIAILYGGPYLVNYIGASASQIVARPVSLKQLYDTNLTTQSKEIFIYHNTGIDRTDADKAANCAPEEKKRYHYAISGWFFLNNNISTKTSDLEIFNFGDVPKMTYNPSKNELKIICDLLSMSDGGASTATELYNSRKNYKAVTRAGHTTDEELNKQTKSIVEMSLEDDELDADILLQRWNYFVINYDGKTMDFFLNNKLIFKSEFIMPDIQLKPITVGSTTDNKGLNGSICNFAFHKYPLTKEQIRWTYNMLKLQNPPMIGMSTVEDQVSVTDTTKVYSR